MKNIVYDNGRNKILQYQVIKTSENALTINVVLNYQAELLQSDIDRIKSEVRMYADVEPAIEVKIVPFIETADNGKSPEFIDLS